jgi:ribonuclease HII
MSRPAAAPTKSARRVRAAPYERPEPRQRGEPLRHTAPGWPSDAPVIGADEAGRGPIAGPLVVAACVAPPGWEPPKEMRDSKKMTEAMRERVFDALLADESLHLCAYAASAAKIDADRHILNTTLAGFARCITMAHEASGATRALVDGNRMPGGLPPGVEARTAVSGDDTYACIAAASVVAKVLRDRFVAGEMHRAYPEFGFASHKAYGQGHVESMKTREPCAEHRTYFAPFSWPAGSERPAPRAHLSWGFEREWASAAELREETRGATAGETGAGRPGTPLPPREL